MTTVERCPATGKHSYPTWEIGVRYALRSSARTGHALRVYQCGCGAYHLTKVAVWTERRAA